MIEALMEWAGTSWGIAVLGGAAWFAVSCLFSIGLGRVMAEFGGNGLPRPARLDQPKRRSPRRAAASTTARKRKRLQKTSNG